MGTELTIADLFCGPGGMSLGYKEFFDVAVAVDKFKDPCTTYRFNLGGKVIQKDAMDLSCCYHDFDGIVGVVGGTPCKPFSKLNHQRKKDDPRIHLWKGFMNVVDEVRPSFFQLENVPTIFIEVKKAIIKRAKELGYIVTTAILDASDYGVPQSRKRWIAVGTKKPFKFPMPTISKRLTVADAIGDIPERQNIGFTNPRPETLERLKSITSGKWESITPGGFANAIQLYWNMISPTVVNLTKVYMKHPDRERLLTETEAAILQDFPLDYKFYGTKTSRCQQIADAAPRSMMREIARSILETQFGGN